MNRSISLILLFLVAFFLNVSALTVTGKVTCKAKGLVGIQVSDGTNIVETDSKGNYSWLRISDCEWYPCFFC